MEGGKGCENRWRETDDWAWRYFRWADVYLLIHIYIHCLTVDEHLYPVYFLAFTFRLVLRHSLRVSLSVGFTWCVPCFFLSLFSAWIVVGGGAVCVAYGRLGTMCGGTVVGQNVQSAQAWKNRRLTVWLIDWLCLLSVKTLSFRCFN